MKKFNLKTLHYINISWAVFILSWFVYKLYGILVTEISKDLLGYIFWVGVFSIATLIGFVLNEKIVRKNLDKTKATIYYDWAVELRLLISLLSVTVFLSYVVWKFKL